MSWWSLYRQSKVHAFRNDFADATRSDRERMKADYGALLVIAFICVPVILTVGTMIVLS
jgi:hypothetical protein